MLLTRFTVGALCVGALCLSCSGSGGNSGAAAGLRVIEFLESGQDDIPRNRTLTFRFSEPVDALQDFNERLKIRNVDRAPGDTNFTPAVGTYVCDGDRVVFTPNLPNREDRTDAGLKANGFYNVFLKSGPDALRSVSGSVIQAEQEFIFDTSEFFEDQAPADPPRAWSLAAVDPSTGRTTDISRLDPRPAELAKLDNHRLIQEDRVIDPGGGGAPSFREPWHLELSMSEPLDPATINLDNIEMFEIFSDATTSDDTAADVDAPLDHYGNPVNYKVPIKVELDQGLDAAGVVGVRIRVIPQIVLVDDTRYRLSFSGNILGLDSRQTFIGENGLTGDGRTPVDGATQPYPEPGGLGYTTEFIVRDRPAISAVRVLTYDPQVDGILPESGQSALTEDRRNTALYDPAASPGTAVGFLADFGNGSDGPLAVTGTHVIDTGDTPNTTVGNPFTVQDLNADDTYNKLDLDKGPRTYDSVEFFELKLESLTISAGGILRVVGVNPILFRVQGVVQINGTLDISGEAGEAAAGTDVVGGVPGAGGAHGGDARRGTGNINIHLHSCEKFASFLSRNSVARANGPYSENGYGPGRGLRGAETYNYGDGDDTGLNPLGSTGTGGGGASHAWPGLAGEDRLNAGAQPGTSGPACGAVHTGTAGGIGNESVVGVRGMPGPTYGDREVFFVTAGGSGGGAGGAVHGNSSWGGLNALSGGGGGGGGGSVAIYAAGSIIATTGTIDASGGDGGKGLVVRPAWQGAATQTAGASGGGGGGSGGAIVLVSGHRIEMTAGLLDARGGRGGPRGNDQTSVKCAGCNAGGDGGKGFIFLMDADGEITGLVPGLPGQYDGYAHGVLTISTFNAERFSSMAAVTELFNVGASDPAYLAMSHGDILADVAENQRVRVYASSSKADPDEPLLPDPTTEMGGIEIALVSHAAGSVNVQIRGEMQLLNPTGVPDRDAFTRIDARFEYGNPVQAALGPFASIDQVEISFTFNG